MSSSDASADDSRDGGGRDGDNAFSSNGSSSSQEDAGDSRRSSFSDSDGAVFISSRSEIVISPRRRVGAATWDAIEPLLSGGGGGGAVLRRAERVSSTRGSNRTRTKSSVASIKSNNVRSTRVGSASGSARRALGHSPTRLRDDGRSGAKEAERGSGVRTDRHRRRKSSEVDQHEEDAVVTTSRGGSGDVRAAGAASDGLTAVSTGGAAAAAPGGGGSDRAESQQAQREGVGVDEERDDSASGDEEEEETKEEKLRTGGTRSQKMPEVETLTKRKRDAAKASKKGKTGTSSRTDKYHSAARGREPTRRHLDMHSSSSQSSSRSPAPATSRKPVSFASETSYGEAVGVLPSPKEEMEELKQTLKKLASHGEDNSIGSAQAPSGATSRPPSPAITSIPESHLHPSHLQVATAALQPPSPAEQIRLGEFVAQQSYANGKAKSSITKQKSTLANGGGSGRSSRHASFDPAALDAKLRMQETLSTASSSRPQSMTAVANGGGAYPNGTEARSSLNLKLFGNARDASGGAASFMPSSTSASASLGMQGILGMGAGAAGAASAGGSRAVLSALKALQDKIRRLEEERETLMQQLSDEKVKARKVRGSALVGRVRALDLVH